MHDNTFTTIRVCTEAQKHLCTFCWFWKNIWTLDDSSESPRFQPSGWITMNDRQVNGLLSIDSVISDIESIAWATSSKTCEIALPLTIMVGGMQVKASLSETQVCISFYQGRKSQDRMGLKVCSCLGLKIGYFSPLGSLNAKTFRIWKCKHIHVFRSMRSSKTRFQRLASRILRQIKLKTERKGRPVSCWDRVSADYPPCEYTTLGKQARKLAWKQQKR